MNLRRLSLPCLFTGVLCFVGCYQKADVPAPTLVLKSRDGRMLGRFENEVLHHDSSRALSLIQVTGPDIERLRRVTAANTGETLDVEIDGKPIVRATLYVPIENGWMSFSSGKLPASATIHETEEKAMEHLIEAHSK